MIFAAILLFLLAFLQKNVGRFAVCLIYSFSLYVSDKFSGHSGYVYFHISALIDLCVCISLFCAIDDKLVIRVQIASCLSFILNIFGYAIFMTMDGWAKYIVAYPINAIYLYVIILAAMGTNIGERLRNRSSLFSSTVANFLLCSIKSVNKI